MGHKTSKVLTSIKYIDELDLNSNEIQEVIFALEEMQEFKEKEEEFNYKYYEEDKQDSLNKLNNI